MRSVHAIVVTYFPRRAALTALLEAIRPQVEGVIIVDNGSEKARDWLRELSAPPRCELVELERNLGVAAAHNQGIERARALGSEFVLLFDQDSLPAPDMVAELTRALVELAAAGERVAAVGPCYVDRRTGRQSPFVRFGFLANEHLYCNASSVGSRIRCDHLITSGSLIPLSVIEQIGPLDTGLFIDNVDTDWCFRALAKGYALYGVCSAVMNHGVGDALIEGWGPFSHRVVVHAPLRLYYIMRNHILLYGRSYTPFRWTLQDLPRLFFKAAVFATSVPPRLKNSSMIVKGIRDGLSGKTGAYGL